MMEYCFHAEYKCSFLGPLNGCWRTSGRRSLPDSGAADSPSARSTGIGGDSEAEVSAEDTAVHMKALNKPPAP